MLPRRVRPKRAHCGRAAVTSRRIYPRCRHMRHFATRHHLEHCSLGRGKGSWMSRYSVWLALATLMAMSPALGQQDEAGDYPNRPVKIVVSVPAGGGVDTVARVFAAGLQQRLGQPFVIENRGGG